MVLAKVPTPLPSEVWLAVISGFGEVLQQTPRSVTGSPPSELITPPDSAEFWVMAVIEVVVKTGAPAGQSLVVKTSSVP